MDGREAPRRALNTDWRYWVIMANGGRVRRGLYWANLGAMFLFFGLTLTCGKSVAALVSLAWLGAWAVRLGYLFLQNERYKAELVEDYLGKDQEEQDHPAWPL